MYMVITVTTHVLAALLFGQFGPKVGPKHKQVLDSLEPSGAAVSWAPSLPPLLEATGDDLT